MARQIKPEQKVSDILLKLIPSEIIAGHLAMVGIIPEKQRVWGMILVSAILLVFTPIFLKYKKKVNDTKQLVITTVAFAIYLYATGGPFEDLGIHEPWIASFLIVLWSLAMPPLFDPKKRGEKNGQT